MNGPYIKQREYVTIFNYDTPQEEFWHNGLCILQPSVCEITEELNGAYELYLEHPLDAEGRWKFIIEQNIIKADGQLFRIIKKGTTMTSDGTKVRYANAVHIFYDMKDKLIIDMNVDGWSPYWFLRNMFDSYIIDDDPEHQFTDYSFSFTTNLPSEPYGYCSFKNSNPVAAILGEDDCFINAYGGEIHRDNFRFSINSRKEGTSENAFEIKYGSNMIDIAEELDYSELVTNLYAESNFGAKFQRKYNPSKRIAHHISKRILFNYNADGYSDEMFFQQANAYFDSVKNPRLSLSVTYANLQNADLYKDFLKIKDCNVGDAGGIYCEPLEIYDTVQIVSKVKDVLRNDTVSIQLGSKRRSLTAKSLMSNTISVNNRPDTSGYFTLIKED